MTRLSFVPVDAYIESRFGNRTVPSDRDGAQWTMQSTQDMLALTVGVHRTVIYKWRKYGLSPVQADYIAIRLGIHPATLWDEWFRLPVGVGTC